MDSDQFRDLNDLDSKLSEARSKENQKQIWRPLGQKTTNTSIGLAFRVAIELVSALMVGLGIGWVLDSVLDTRPWLMLIFLVFGGAAGILNVYRQALSFSMPQNNKEEETQTKC